MLSRRSLLRIGVLSAPLAALGSVAHEPDLQEILESGRRPAGRYVLHDKLVLRHGHILDGLVIEWRGPDDADAMIEIVHSDVSVTRCKILSGPTKVPFFRLTSWTPSRISDIECHRGDDRFLIA